MKKLVLIIFLALVGFTTQAQCARCKHPKAYIEKKTGISYPCIHWYRVLCFQVVSISYMINQSSKQ